MNKATTFQVIVAAVCLITTFYAYASALRVNELRSAQVFDTLIDDSQAAIVQRLDNYVYALDGAAGLLSASDNVSRADWRRYVDTLMEGDGLSDVSGIGFIVPFMAEDQAAFEVQARRDGVENLNIYPDTGLPERFVIKYIEPIETNREAVGLDVAFTEGRRDVLNAARDSGEPKLSPRILLVQDETRSPGFLILRPFYQPGLAVSTLQERLAAFRGWVYAPFVGNRVMDNLTRNIGSAYHLTVYDGASADPDAMIFNSVPTKAADEESLLTQSRTFDLYGRTWHAVWHSMPEFESARSSRTPLIVLLLGLGLTAMIYLLFRSISGRAETIQNIVDQRTRELTATQDQNKSIIENAMIVIMVLDGDMKILKTNQAIKSILGYEQQEATGRILTEIIPGFNLDGGSQGRPLYAFSKSGAALVLDTSVNRWVNASGEDRYSVLVRDISEEHQAQQSLEQSEERWNLALKGAEIGVFDIDLENETSVVSDTWMELMHLPLDDDTIDPQHEFLTRVHPDDLPNLRRADVACIRGETDRSISQFRVKVGTGEWRWMRSDAVIVERDSRLKALRMVGAQTDVTDLMSARDALRTSREEFRLVIENAPAAMAILYEDGSFEGVNDAFCNLTGYSRIDLHGMRFRDLVRRDELSAIYTHIIEMVKTENNRYLEEHRIVARDGTEIWGLVSVAWSVSSGSGKPKFICQIQDISEIKRLERIKSEFVATVSHELRTPLTSIKGAIGLIIGTMASDIPENSKRLLDIAESNCNRLISLVNDILDMEKISSGEVEFELAKHEINALVQSSVEQTAPFAQHHGVTLRVELPQESSEVWIDTGRTEQVLTNLMSNSAKFSNAGQEVLVKVEVMDTHVRVSVIDQGRGIPPEFRDRIFQPFSQADSSNTRHKQGTGLGLNISKQIVERMGGQIGFESVPDVETTFWFTLPLHKNEPDEPVSRLPQVSGTVQPRVLHIEDDRDFLHVVGTAMGNRAEYVTADTLAKAREQIGDRRFDVIIVDWDMPDGDSLALLDIISERQPSAVVIALTAQARNENDARVQLEIIKSRNTLEEMLQRVFRVLDDATAVSA